MIQLFAGKWNEILACIAATFGALCLGTTLGWSSPAGPKILEDESIGADEGGISLISSLMTLGALVGGLIGGFLLEKLGRKRLMIINSVPCIAGWLLIAFGQNVPMIIAGRMLTGLTSGIYSLAIPVYIGECASAKVRGMLGSGFQLFITIGILYTFLVGDLLPWNWFSFTCACLPVIFAAMMLPMPESPAFHLKKGDNDAAKAALRWLRGPNADIGTELDVIKKALEESRANSATFKDLLLPQNLRPFIVSMGLMLLQQLSGINVVIFYTVQIFKDAGSEMSPFMQTIIVGVVQVVATVVALMLMDSAGRRLLLVVSDLFMGVALVGLGVFFYLEEETAKDLGWLPLACMILFIVMFSLGFGPIPWMMMGEVFPGNVRGMAASIATAFNWTMAFVITMTFSSVLHAIGTAATFWMFGAICGLGIIFIVIFVPETKGKTLEEIQAYFGTFSADPSAA